jgi:hypothetical protein
MKTPVLFLIYNRPQYTEKVFEAIRNAEPERLFISADGPKSGKSADLQLCEEVRRIVTKIDWPCTVKTLLRDENLGCKLGMSSGINWFFDQVDEGIILEDDCLPNKSFFRFSEMMLEKYRDENKIMMIAGSNPATSVNIEDSYLFSRFYTIWGWATWKRAWNKFDINITAWPKLKADRFLETIFSDNLKNRNFIERMFDEANGNENCSVWSLQWTFACLVNNAFAIIPKHNLVSNIGLIGTHEMNNNQLFMEEQEIDYNDFLHPKQIKIDQYIEDLFFEKSGLE